MSDDNAETTEQHGVVIKATVNGPNNPLGHPQKVREYGDTEEEAVSEVRRRMAKHLDLFGTDDPDELEITYEVIA